MDTPSSLAPRCDSEYVAAHCEASVARAHSKAAAAQALSGAAAAQSYSGEATSGLEKVGPDRANSEADAANAYIAEGDARAHNKLASPCAPAYHESVATHEQSEVIATKGILSQGPSVGHVKNVTAGPHHVDDPVIESTVDVVFTMPSSTRPGPDSDVFAVPTVAPPVPNVALGPPGGSIDITAVIEHENAVESATAAASAAEIVSESVVEPPGQNAAFPEHVHGPTMQSLQTAAGPSATQAEAGSAVPSLLSPVGDRAMRIDVDTQCHQPDEQSGDRTGAIEGEESSGVAAIPPVVSHWTEGQRCIVPKPFIRLLRYHMDACAGTNKSQFSFGGLALLTSLGVLDAINVVFMVPGHTKFGPDKVARAIAGVFNRCDTHNPGMLLSCAEDCSSAQVYDKTTLYDWKACTSELFGSVDSIMSYRQFMIVADDGAFDAGPDVALPRGLPPFPGASAKLFCEKALSSAVESLAHRSLQTVVRECLKGQRRGGIGSGSSRDPPKHLHVNSVTSFRRVRLFMRRNESEPVWREQGKWMKHVDLESFNSALAKLVPYESMSDVGRTFYGGKEKGLREQYERYVPPKFVPDEFDILPRGQVSDMAMIVQRQFHVSEFFNSEQAIPFSSGEPVQTRSKPKNQRWRTARDAQILVDIIKNKFNGKIPRSSADVQLLARTMPGADPGCIWDGGKLRKYALEIQAKCGSGLTL